MGVVNYRQFQLHELCPVSKKVRFSTRRKAKLFADKKRKEHGRKFSRYLCQHCGFYHIATIKVYVPPVLKKRTDTRMGEVPTQPEEMTMGLKTKLYDNVNEIKDEGLREEALCYQKVIAGSALLPKEDGGGIMEGFYDEAESRAMVTWAGESSDWIECDSLAEAFKIHGGY